jgi:hypothetical protein
MGTSLKSTLALVAVSMTMPSVASAQTATVDFEGLTEGSVVSTVSSGAGASGASFDGSISVVGTNPLLTGNAAVVFDATCSLAGGGFEGPGAGGTAADCSGDDTDLFRPSNGKVLIVGEDLAADAGGRIEDPDDADNTSQVIELDFSGFGPGQFDVGSVDILDVDGPETTGRVIASRDGAVIGEVPIPVGSDGNLQTLNLGFAQADALRFDLSGSAAIDNLVLVGAAGLPPTQPPPSGGPTPPSGVPTPPTVAPTAPTVAPTPPSGGVAPETVVPGRARLRTPSGCVRGFFTASVRGRAIASVRFAVNGRRVKTVRRPNAKGAFAARINSVKYGVGAHKLTARVTFRKASGTPARTLSARFFRCRPASLPRFTG